MANEVAIPFDPNDRSYDGTAMSRLNERKRRFVIAMLQMGVNPKAASRAAASLGYHPNYGNELMRDEAILAALREEATKRLAGAALVGVNVLLEIAQSPTHKDQFKAAKELAGINGFTAEQRIVVEHIGEDSKQQIRQIREMAQQLGLEPRQLIEAAGIVDAEYEEVTPAEKTAGKKGTAENSSLTQVDDSDW